LVCRDEATLPLLETTSSVKQRYLKQTGRCQVDFLFRALEIGTGCDLTYKTSKNPRLHVELALIRLCRLTSENGQDSEKKKPELKQEKISQKSEPADIPLPSRSEILREESKSTVIDTEGRDAHQGKHTPVFVKPSKTFSIKDIISDEIQPGINPAETSDASVIAPESSPKIAFTSEAFEKSWPDFINQLTGEGPRIVSMFKAVKPEVENDQTIRIHLSNAAQKDTFIANYKQKLLNFLQTRFVLSQIDIETTIDSTDTNNILYTDEQRYNYLFNKYPILKEMKKNFNLDIT
jgi:DNA polymerase-3 subunit gamma/tau